jgi:hypothetical protein
VRSSVLPWRSLGASPPGPDANRRAEFPVPSLWAKLLEEIRLGHSSAERRPGIVDVKNGVTGRVRSGLSENTHWRKLSAVTFRRVFLHLQCLSDRQGRAARQKDLGNFRIWFSRHGFQDLRSQLWGLGNFRIWFSRHGFQDLGSQLWGLDFHTRGFQDRNLKTFRTWFSGCGISILGPGFHTGI